MGQNIWVCGRPYEQGKCLGAILTVSGTVHNQTETVSLVESGRIMLTRENNGTPQSKESKMADVREPTKTSM